MQHGNRERDMSLIWPKPLRGNSLRRSAPRRRTTCVGPDDLGALRRYARSGFGRFCGSIKQPLAGAVEPFVAADDAGKAAVASGRRGRRAAELCR